MKETCYKHETFSFSCKALSVEAYRLLKPLYFLLRKEENMWGFCLSVGFCLGIKMAQTLGRESLVANVQFSYRRSPSRY